MRVILTQHIRWQWDAEQTLSTESPVKSTVWGSSNALWGYKDWHEPIPSGTFFLQALNRPWHQGTFGVSLETLMFSKLLNGLCVFAPTYYRQFSNLQRLTTIKKLVQKNNLVALCTAVYAGHHEWFVVKINSTRNPHRK